MKLLYVCKSVDQNHRSLAHHVRWIRALAADERIEHVYVLTPVHGEADLPDNVTVRAFGRGLWRGIPGFYRELFKIGPRAVDAFFVVQGGPYPALLLPIKLVTRRPIYHWKAQPHVSPRMQFYLRVCDDLVFTATPSGFPVRHHKVRVVGHGIDTDAFRPAQAAPDRDVIAVGRVAPAKRIEQVIAAVAHLRQHYGTDTTLDVVGPCSSGNQAYLASLKAQVSGLGLDGKIRFPGSVVHHELPSLIARYRAVISLSENAFDKTNGEAMAAGVPVVTSNPATAEILPADLSRTLIMPRDDVGRQAEILHSVVTMDDDARSEVGRRLREIVVAGQSVDSLFGKILDEIQRHRFRPDTTERPALARR